MRFPVGGFWADSSSMFGGVSGNGGVWMSGTARGESGVLDILSESSELSE